MSDTTKSPGAAEQADARPETGGDQHRGEPQHPGVPLAPPGIVPESDVRVHSPAAAMPHREHGLVEELGELPWGYGDGRLVGLPRDPNTLFVYWDFSQTQVDGAFAGLGPARAFLKLWSAKTGGELVREEEIHLESRGWYVRNLPAGAELRAEVWAVGERGARMVRAARPMRLPPAAPSDVLEAFYLRLPLDKTLPREGVSAGHPLHYGGAAPAGWERRTQPRGSSPMGTMPSSTTHVPGGKE